MANKKKNLSKKIIVFGHGQVTKVCIQEFCKLGYQVLLFFPKEKLSLFNYYKYKQLKVDCEIFSDLEGENLAQKIKNFAPDYIFTIIFAYKLPAKLIKLAKVMSLNLHPSLLPEYRSYNPYFWVIRKGEKISGVTIHKLTENWDSGPIIYQKKFSLHEYETIGTYATRVEFYAKYIIQDLHNLMQNEKFKEIPQPGSPYYPKVKYKDIVINWAQPAKTIESLVRASNPKPGGLTYYRNMILRILETNLSPYQAGKPGEISLIEGDLFVSANDNMLKINIIESSKEGIFSGQRFANFCSVRSGEMFQNLGEFMQEEDLGRYIS